MNNDEFERVAITLIKKFAKKELADGFKLIDKHPYYDETGKLLYFRLRLKHSDGRKWIRPFHFSIR